MPNASTTLLQRAEEALELSHRRTRLYEAVLSTTPDFIYIFDLDHRFIYANQALLTAWGKTWDQAIGTAQAVTASCASNRRRNGGFALRVVVMGESGRERGKKARARGVRGAKTRVLGTRV